MARIKKGVKVCVESTNYFTNQNEARDYAIKVLEAGALFINVETWFEEVEDPEPPKPEPPKPEPKPEKPEPKKRGRRGPYKPRGQQSKYNQEVIDYIKEYYPSTTVKKLVPRLNKMFDLDLNEYKLKDLIKTRRLTKRTFKKKKIDPLKDEDPEHYAD